MNREYTKARFVAAVDVLKEAYAKLAAMLVDSGALGDEDLIYFFTHEELGRLLSGEAKLLKKAIRRRRLLDEQMEIRYGEVYIGRPVPAPPEGAAAKDGLTLSGAALSRGEATGAARVVRSIADARRLKKGEIMVAAFTDIGWSPYYSVIAGLVTEVGSALSHGAVVAREYALPLVANVARATDVIKTGSMVTVNGAAGTVTILESPCAESAEEEKEAV